ncbi:MAG: hypothetical protein IJ416_03470 [Ruminiclostridium sp.]|nr:hypothetical protein [Ruminiclostridium sp.]
MGSVLTTLIVIGIIAAAIAIGVAVIRYKLNRFTKRYLGKNLSQVGDAIREGLNDDSRPPRTISVKTSIHQPKFQRDFPDMSYSQIESMAKNALTSYLSAIESQNVNLLYEPSLNLTQQFYDRLQDNASRGVEHFDNVKIHRAALANYINSDGVVDAVFEISFECYHFFQESEKLNAPNQLACSVTLNHGRALADGSVIEGHNCPNCGAPIVIKNNQKMCEYCGSGFEVIDLKVWLADSIKFI